MLATETLVIELLLIVSLVAIAVRRLRIPYTVALVLVGLLITSQQAFQQGPQIGLTSEIILALFVPPLVFEAAFHLGLDRLRENIVPILVLAVPGVLLTTGIVGLIVTFGVGLPLASGLLFGALISATDPVAVVALFRALSVPKRLAVLVEGESLLNDGTAIVTFNLMLVAAVPAVVGSASTGSFDLVGASLDFLRVSLLGAGLGVGLGWLTSQLIARLDDYLIETTLTTILAFGAYLVAERIGVSGVLAVVAAGVVAGSSGAKTMSPTTRIVLTNFWEYAAFVVNSLVFLLIGLDVNLPDVTANLGPIGIAVLATLVSRLVVVYGLTGLVNLRGEQVPSAYKHVLLWGGLRGAIGLALALSLPAALAERETLRVMTYGVVLFTLLFQGTTMQFLLKALKVYRADTAVREFERRHARLASARAALGRVEQLRRRGLVSARAWEQIRASYEGQIRTLVEEQHALLREHPALEAAAHDRARIEGLRAARTTLTALSHDGAISSQVYEELLAEIDAALEDEAAPALEPDASSQAPQS